jgi:hypothetical protein
VASAHSCLPAPVTKGGCSKSKHALKEEPGYLSLDPLSMVPCTQELLNACLLACVFPAHWTSWTWNPFPSPPPVFSLQRSESGIRFISPGFVALTPVCLSSIGNPPHYALLNSLSLKMNTLGSKILSSNSKVIYKRRKIPRTMAHFI